MGILRFNYRSEELGRYVDVTIVIPTDPYTYHDELGEKFGGRFKGKYTPGMKYQTIYLIHGGGDDDTLTYRYTNAERYAEENNVMLVTPNITNSFGVDTKYGVKYQTFIAKELPKVVQSLFPSSPKREDNFIMGYAMGGNVALGTALLHPENYAACVDLSGGIGMTLDTKLFKEELDGDYFKNNFNIYNTTFGEGKDLEGSDYDLYSAATKSLKDGVAVPNLFIACGSKEFIRERVEGDVKILKKIGYPVTYECAQGYDHDFEMWDKYIRVAIEEWLPLKNWKTD